MSEKQVRDYDKFMLRFPDGMRDAIAERARINGRSMNSEIIQVLEDYLSDPKGPSLNEVDEHLLDVAQEQSKIIKEQSAAMEKQGEQVDRLIKLVEESIELATTFRDRLNSKEKDQT